MSATPSNSAPSNQTLAAQQYAAGIQHEQEGSLSHAMICFQKAFKLDPDVDVVFKARRASSSSTTDWDEDEDEGHLTHLPNPANLAALFSQESLCYTARKKNKPVHINRLPSEMLVAVLCELSLQSLGTIAQFALVCKPFYLLTRSPTLWRHASEFLFKQPQALPLAPFDQLPRYSHNWMTMMKCRPRLRFDGVYISVCKYVRPGESETPWTRPVHLVTHYRYIRFYPDGTMVHLLTNEEPNKWDGATKVQVQMEECTRPVEKFTMDFDIQHPYPNTKDKRRPYKLQLTTYSSQRTDREEMNLYSLSHVKPFLFSRVISYHVAF
ncbi:hypothetical protein DM01DRAFT_325122 [Hesseltinella vesiculosa]|uniref:F-box domain-containing protein n=1 Tax=Hesseltinella vesiculosa TaxID=101127 RepID=A0A1X2GHK4_9FUNG|nr:hypothetical protein DM01DRAFT_325122 [Hesseltinella vesiculosa]